MFRLRIGSLFLATLPVVAGPVYYGWPPPGVPPTLTAAGNAGDARGLTYIFTNFDLSFGSLYWTVEDVMKPNNNTTGPAGKMHFSGFNAEIMSYVWAATSPTLIPVDSGQFPRYATEFWLQLQDASGNPIQASHTRSGLGLTLEPGRFGEDVPVHQVTGEFGAVLQFVTDTGIPFNEVWNNTPFKSEGAFVTYDATGAFYADTEAPEPAVMTLCGLGLLVVGLIRRRR